MGTIKIKVVDKLELFPQGEYILVKVDKDDLEGTSGGIIIPTGALQNKKTQTGVIVGMGYGRRDPNDCVKHVPPECQVGQHVLFACYIGYPVVIKGEEYVIIKNLDVMCVVREEYHMVDNDDSVATDSKRRAI